MTFTLNEMAAACRELALSAQGKVYEVHDADKERWLLRRASILEAAAAYIEATANVPPHGTDDGGD